MTGTVTVWAIYRSPLDHPGKWVLRGHDVPGGPRDGCVVADTLDAARAGLPRGLHRLPPMPQDDPKIHEVWL